MIDGSQFEYLIVEFVTLKLVNNSTFFNQKIYKIYPADFGLIYSRPRAAHKSA